MRSDPLQPCRRVPKPSRWATLWLASLAALLLLLSALPSRAQTPPKLSTTRPAAGAGATLGFDGTGRHGRRHQPLFRYQRWPGVGDRQLYACCLLSSLVGRDRCGTCCVVGLERSLLAQIALPAGWLSGTLDSDFF